MEFEGPNKTSEYEKRVKLMVEKQTGKKISLKKQFEQHKSFIAVENQLTVPETFRGFHTLPELQIAQINQDELNNYKLAGLSNDEIELYSQYQKNVANSVDFPTTTKNVNMGMEPTVLMGKIEEIKLKLKQFIQSKDTEQFNLSGVLKDPFYHVAQLSMKIDSDIQRKRKKATKNQEKSTLIPDNHAETKTGETKRKQTVTRTSLLHVAVSLEEDHILQNRLSLDEINKMEQFKKYTPGNPSNILYLKNLHHKVDIRELIALFGRFDAEENIKYRILNGKMRGQAFITFQDKERAEKAFTSINGYKLRNRPIIIEYSRKRNEESI